MSPKKSNRKLSRKTREDIDKYGDTKATELSNIHEVGIRLSLSGFSDRKRKWVHPVTYEPCSVEEGVLGYYSQLGWEGAHDEGALLQSIAPIWSQHLIASSYKYNQSLCYTLEDNSIQNSFGVTKNKLTEFFYDAEEATFQNNLKECFHCYESEQTYNPFAYVPYGLNEIKEVFARVDRPFIERLVFFLQQDIHLTRGWPDLTLWRDNELMFVEVKAPKDRLSRSQTNTIKNVFEPMDMEVTIASAIPTPLGPNKEVIIKKDVKHEAWLKSINDMLSKI